MLPPDPARRGQPDEILDLLDGRSWPAAPTSTRPPTARTGTRRPTARPERDTFEIALARRALERDMPLLGICRGMQLLNVARGGTLIQHLPDARATRITAARPAPSTAPTTTSAWQPGSLAARAAGEELHATKSHHHQGVDGSARAWR